MKHDHKDAILSVEEISFEEFLDGMEQKANEPYFRCINPQQQKLYWEEIVQHIFPESRSYDEDREGKRVRRPRYQESFNWRNYDWDDAA